MPNWVINEVKMEGLETSKLISKKTHEVDFNGIIHMPKSLSTVVAGGYEREAILLVADRFEKALEEMYPSSHPVSFVSDSMVEDAKSKFGNDEKEIKKLVNQGIKYMSNFVKHGSFDWYEWSNKNWGTKWNADTQRVNNNVAYFETAWSAPIPVIKELSERYSKRIVTINWCDESPMHSGSITFLGGEIVRGGYDENGSSEQAERYEALWGYPMHDESDDDNDDDLEESM